MTTFYIIKRAAFIIFAIFIVTSHQDTLLTVLGYVTLVLNVLDLTIESSKTVWGVHTRRRDIESTHGH